MSHKTRAKSAIIYPEMNEIFSATSKPTFSRAYENLSKFNFLDFKINYLSSRKTELDHCCCTEPVSFAAVIKA